MGIVRQVLSRLGSRIAISRAPALCGLRPINPLFGGLFDRNPGISSFRNLSSFGSSRTFSIWSRKKTDLELNGSVGSKLYYVDRYGVRHFQRKSRWSGGVSQKLIFVTWFLGGFTAVMYYMHLEVVPYTNRKHFVLISPNMEAKLGETTFNNMKQQFKNKILPAQHPAVIRVAKIAQQSIRSAMEGIHATGYNDLEYAVDLPSKKKLPSSRSREYMLGPAEDVEQPSYFMKLGEKELYSDSEITMDDVWVEDSRKTGIEKGRKPQTKHIANFKWEIVVVDANVVNAACLPGGKIIVFTGLLKAFPRDEELATVIGHEVGHAIARHTGEMLTRSIFIGFIELLFLAVLQVPNIVGPASDLLLRLPFSRRMEIEADHIGALVMAAAGYDPRVAPTVYLRLGDLQKIPEFVQYMSTHPSGRARSEGLLKSQTLKEAIRIYESKRGGWDSSGFLV